VLDHCSIQFTLPKYVFVKLIHVNGRSRKFEQRKTATSPMKKQQLAWTRLTGTAGWFAPMRGPVIL